MSTTERVRRQYEDYPYPARDPADEKKRLIRTMLDGLPQINHYGFRGRRDVHAGLRVLVAGGGTGDSLVYLAEQLRESDATLVYLDLSEASMAVARARARVRGLEERVTWHQGSLLDLPDLGWEPFDYINCSGVLHHLADPPKGLAALRAVLRDEGAMGLMVYGQYGRTGVYQMQALMRLINHDATEGGTQVANLRTALDALPPTHWLKRGEKAMPLLEERGDDIGLYDLLLHPQDRAYTVPELHAFLGDAGLRLAAFATDYRALYDPAFAFRKAPSLRAQVEKLPLVAQQAACELFWGSIGKHVFWAAPRDSVADASDEENVPFYHGPAAEIPNLQEAVLTTPRQTLTFSVTSPECPPVVHRLELTPLRRHLLAAIDGTRTLGEIVDTVAAQPKATWTREEVAAGTAETLAALAKLDLVLLRHRSVPARR